MEIHKGIAALILAVVLLAGSFGGALFFPTEKTIITEKLVEKECPIVTCPEVTCPNITIPEVEVESADNELLNEFLENEFEFEFNQIKDAAEEFALEELFDDDYEVVVDYLKTLLAEGEELDEDSIEIGGDYIEDIENPEDVDLEDIEIEVTKLGLGEEEDKSARVTFEIEVEYELEEGVRDEFEKDLVIVYDVVFDEGEFDDEEVKLVSIV